MAYIVVGRQVRVGDGPVLPIAVVGLGLEVQVRQPEGQPAPDVGLPAQAAGSYPGLAGAGVGVVVLVDQDVLDVIRARPSAHVGIQVPERGGLAVRGASDGVFVEGKGV